MPCDRGHRQANFCRRRSARTGSNCRGRRSTRRRRACGIAPRSRPRGSPIIDVLDDSMMAQSGITQSGGKTLVAAMGDLAIEQADRANRHGSGWRLRRRLRFRRRPGPCRPARAGRVGRVSDGSAIPISQSVMVVAGSADVGVEDRHSVSRLALVRRGDRACGRGSSAPSRRSACRSRWRALPPLRDDRAERPHQAHDAEAGAEALFGMRPALQDQLT